MLSSAGETIEGAIRLVPTFLLSQDPFKFNLVPKRDSILPQHRDLGLQSTGPFKGIRVDGSDVKAPLLIEAESTQIVVCRYEPEPFAASLDSGVSHGVEQ